MPVGGPYERRAGMAVGTALSATLVGALDEVQSDVQEVKTSGAGLASWLKTALQTAFNNLQDTLQDLPSEETVAEAGSSVEDAVQQLDTARMNALDALNCSSGS
jgi:hypothetical protein